MDSTELSFHVLAQVATGKNRHGYGITDSLNARLETRFQVKRIYAILHAQEGDKLVKRSINANVKAGPPKFDYMITAKGKRHLGQLAKTMRFHAQRVQDTLNQLNEKYGDDYGNTGTSA